MNNKLFSLLMALAGASIIVDHPKAWVVSALILGFSAGMYFWPKDDAEK